MPLPRRLLAAALVAGLFCYRMVGAQEPSPAPAQSSESVFHAGSNLVLVPSLVQTKTGELVYSLEAGDFSLLDNGLAQKIDLIEGSTPQPLALVVVLETSGNGARQQEYLRGLATMVDQMVENVPHRVALVCFGSQVSVVDGFSSNLERVGEDIKHPPAQDGEAAILDAVAVALQKLNAQPKEYRKAILLVSEMVDHGSRTKKEQMVRLIGESNTTIYSVAFSPARMQWKDALTGPGGSNPPYNLSIYQKPVVAYFDLMPLLNMALGGMGKNAAEEMAQLSGGEYIRFNDQKEFDREIGTIGNHMHNQYLLGFQPSNPTEGFHSLRVGLVNRPELSITSRNSYWFSK